ncbi:hypothetical protein ACODNH_02615 (plasmid) [Haloarcula sp. NS06]
MGERRGCIITEHDRPVGIDHSRKAAVDGMFEAIEDSRGVDFDDK